MERFIKLDGTNIVKNRCDIVIKKGCLVTYNPSDEMLAENGWVLYNEPELTEEEELNFAKEEMFQKIKAYDESPDVNLFYINDFPVWLDKNTRTGLKLRFEAEMVQDKNTTTLGYEGYPFELTIEQAVQLLYLIEVYASACYDNTQRHIAKVRSLENIEDVVNYDFTTGYPDKLRL